MAKKIVRITESDLVNIVKRVLNEQGGYDDPIQMAMHGGATLSGLGNIVNHIIELLTQSIEMLGKNIPKHKRVSTISKISNVLEIIEDNLRKIRKEIMGNRELRRAVSDLRRAVETGRNRVSTLGSFTSRFADPEMPAWDLMPGGLTGVGLEMGDKDLNDKLVQILLNISTKAEKLEFEIGDENENILRRLDNLN
jgi:hypothetical protein